MVRAVKRHKPTFKRCGEFVYSAGRAPRMHDDRLDRREHIVHPVIKLI
jgi:hypothetical protein